jgi:hypothetical protein
MADEPIPDAAETICPVCGLAIEREERVAKIGHDLVHADCAERYPGSPDDGAQSTASR